MKRQDIISKLMNEGFSQKTLVNLTDKQLSMLSERILSEQYGTTSTTTYGTTGANATTVLNIPKTDIGSINRAKTQKKTFSTYEGEVKEDELKGAPEKAQEGEKEIVLKRINHRIETKMKKDECVKSEVELLKRMGKKIPEKVQKYCDARKDKKKEMMTEPAEQSTKPISNIPVVDGSNKEIKKWVNKLVESKYFTSKHDIMDLVKKNLNEQVLAEPATKPKTKPDIDAPERTKNPDDPFRSPTPGTKIAPKAGGEKPSEQPGNPKVEPDVHPGTAPSINPNEDDPFKSPTPGIKIAPKAKKEISPEMAKNKILSLMMQEI